MKLTKEKKVRYGVIFIFLIIILALHLKEPNYYFPNSKFASSFLVDILLPAYLFLLFTLFIYRLPSRWSEQKRTLIVLLMAAITCLAGFIIETLQYFDIHILGSTFDIWDYGMYFLGAILGLGIDYFILKISKKNS